MTDDMFSDWVSIGFCCLVGALLVVMVTTQVATKLREGTLLRTLGEMAAELFGALVVMSILVGSLWFLAEGPRWIVYSGIGLAIVLFLAFRRRNRVS